ncbi:MULTISPECIES: malate:quinone oxidoreductase [Myroides]|nr:MULTISPECIES: malate:quinone oxidoreductase [Myroides]MDX4972305.1 malate:quinone oxidoreductase [Myroides odoratimimus]MEC4028601.1 malate:quinone oxidoreductase [Myroides odoratimimus]MEC4041349.1 malate:quinone oxidoreductase [Myroides odoratimimus]MEC4092838.1 malate:quinone oxidoreductase [Myroides odoratimimus]MEC4149268.1 malate:quinone oxidoreductase [Myroides odoratimimus]
MMSSIQKSEADVVLVGAGIMSATLGVLLKELKPNLKIEVIERLDSAAAESSDAMNNAGTGHSAFCELNYTPEKADGTIDASKAINIVEQFEVSRQFWSYLVNKGVLKNPSNFIHTVPHMSFVWGEDNVNYLRKRYNELQKYPLFQGMEFSDNKEKIKEWAPLIIENRKENEVCAATHMNLGTDVNFGDLTRQLFDHLKSEDGVNMTFNCEVKDITKTGSEWTVSATDSKGQKKVIKSKFVFVGAGGGAILLLQKADIAESKGYGGFPVGGEWLVCRNPEVVKKHMAKVYGKASVGAPPMSVPHLDTRFIDGKHSLLFGPYAGFSTKFLKRGSYWDLIKSLEFNNIGPMLGAGLRNMDLTKYLIEQVLQSSKSRYAALREYYPDAKEEDWKLEKAGQRVQVIKKDKDGKGILQFGTEVVSAADGSIAALLGASPGASTATPIMLKLLSQCFKEEFKSAEWQAKFKEMIPTFGLKLNEHPELVASTRDNTSKTLKIYPYN